MANHILQGDDAHTIGNLVKVISVLIGVMVTLIVVALALT